MGFKKKADGMAARRAEIVQKPSLDGATTSDLERWIRAGEFTTQQMQDIAANANQQYAPAVVKQAANQLNLLAHVNGGKLTEKELIQQHDNASACGGKHIVAAVEAQMRGQFPKGANRMFGKKKADTTLLLESVCEVLAMRVDLSKNKVKSGVKPGGEMLSGRKVVNEFISFRGLRGYGAYLSLEQHTVNSELIVAVGHYKVGAGRFRTERVFKMDDFASAANDFYDFAVAAA